VPWKETNVMDLREQFIEDWLRRTTSISELCERYEVSRKTGGKWIQRYHEGGRSGLVDRSRRPHHIANRVEPRIEEEVLKQRKLHPLWGPKKLRAWLDEHYPNDRWPAESTIGALLKERGLIGERRKRQRTPHGSEPLSAPREANELWATDFKGCFRVGGKYTHPLTISDGCTRFLIRVQSLLSERTDLVKPEFEAAFREYGLPLRIRSDNGAPFASRSIAGLSELSVWWIKLGITPERIVPGKPQQNGRHERMHKTLKAETASPPRTDTEAQQQAFDEFRRCYNEERPHEALGQRTPASLYSPSPRSFPATLHDPEYPNEFEVRQISGTGNLLLDWS
jgi:putative transposase